MVPRPDAEYPFAEEDAVFGSGTGEGGLLIRLSRRETAAGALALNAQTIRAYEWYPGEMVCGRRTLASPDYRGAPHWSTQGAIRVSRTLDRMPLRTSCLSAGEQLSFICRLSRGFSAAARSGCSWLKTPRRFVEEILMRANALLK